MAVLLIVALLASAVSAGSITVRCSSCCDEPSVAGDMPAPPCCRVTPVTPSTVARSGGTGTTAIRHASIEQPVTPLVGSRPHVRSFVALPFLRPLPLVLRI